MLFCAKCYRILAPGWKIASGFSFSTTTARRAVVSGDSGRLPMKSDDQGTSKRVSGFIRSKVLPKIKAPPSEEKNDKIPSPKMIKPIPDQVPRRAFPHRNRPVRRFRSPDSIESRRTNQELMGNSKRIVSAMGNYSKSQPDVGTSRYEAELREENSSKDDEEEGQFSIPGAEDENEVATMEDTVEDNWPPPARRSPHSIALDEVNRYRPSVYNHGELDKTDLTKPPSRTNPHPFDPASLPPTHSQSLAPYANHLPLLQKLVDIGVDLFQIDLIPKLGRHLVRQDWDRDVRPKLLWLIQDVGMNVEDVGGYLTRNPFFLLQDLDDMKVRVNYLAAMKFPKPAIAKIILGNRYWINNEVKIIDARLGFLQKQFALKDKEVRALILKEPRTIQYGLGPLHRMVQVLNEELRFTVPEMKQMLMEDPRIWMMNPEPIKASHAYLQNTIGFSNRRIAEYPFCLRVPVLAIRTRHEFLKRLKRDQYEPEMPDSVSIGLLLHSSDKEFCNRAAKTFLVVYNSFLRKS